MFNNLYDQLTQQQKSVDTQFSFIRFNARRYLKGQPATLVEVTFSNGEVNQVWMSLSDVLYNIEEFGPREALIDAAHNYGYSVNV